MTSRWVSFGIAGLVFAADYVSKLAIRIRVAPFETIPVIPHFFNIVHAENPGIAFSLFSSASGAWRSTVLIGLSAVVILFIAFLLWRDVAGAWLLRIGLALVLGGAAGNLYDRIETGTVTDFVELYAGTYYFPAFNVADSAISIGAGLLLVDALAGNRRAGKVKSDHVS